MDTSRRARPLVYALLALAALFLAAAPPAGPALAIGGAVVVKSLADTDLANQDNCTLREALQGISLARSDPNVTSYHECTGIQQGINTVTFAVSGVIKPASSLPDISSNISITGPIIIDGSANTNSPVFRVSTSDAIFNMAALTLTKGQPAILMTNNQAIVNIAGSSFVGNTNSGDGGAINGSGRVNIAGSNFTGNQSTSGNGGAIAMISATSLNIAGSVFNGNIAKHSGGAVYMASPGTIVDTVFNGNIAQGSDPNNDGNNNQFDDYFTVGGGAIYAANNGGNDKLVSIIRSVFNGNLAAPYGNAGALYNATGAEVLVRDSSFNANISGSAGNDRLGGAILNAGAKLDVTRVTLMANVVTGDGGGIAIDRTSPVSVTNTTVVANVASGKGGGIYNFNTQQGSNLRPQLVLRNATISSNVGGQGGGIFAQDPTTSYPEVTVLGNTIVSGSDGSGGNCAGGPFTSRGHNLDSGASCGLAGTGDLQNASAGLQAPSFNGGPLADLLSQKLDSTSQAIDGGDPQICADDPVSGVDQRSKQRGGDGNGDGIGGCDIGAYEGDALKAGYASTPVQPGPIDVGTIQIGSTGSVNFTITSTGNKDLQVSAQLQGPNAAEFAVPSFPSTVTTNAQATVSCSPVGSPGTRLAKLVVTTNDPDNPSVAYDLLCEGTAVPVPGYGSNPPAPGPIDFGTSLVGQGRLGGFYVFETGSATLTVNTPQISGPNAADFAIGAVNLTLADGAAQTGVLMGCVPSAVGIRTATLTLATNDPTQPTVAYTLSCTGKAPPTPVLTTGNSTNSGITTPYGLALSPDGRNLYVADDTGDQLVAYNRDSTTGDLTLNSNAPLLTGAIRTLVSPDGLNVYVTDSGLDDVRAYSRDPASGQLSFLDSVTNGAAYTCGAPCVSGNIRGLDGAYGMALSPDGKYLYVAGYSNTASPDQRTILILRRSPDGGLAGFSNNPNYVANVDSTQLVTTYDLAISPDGGYLYAAGWLAGPGRIVAFKRDAATGLLTAVAGGVISGSTVPALDQGFRLEFSPDGVFLYVATYDQNAVVVLKRNPLDGKLSHVATYTDGGLDEDGKTIDGLAETTAAKVSPDGKYLFVTGFTDAALAVFERDVTTGRLVFVQAIKKTAGQPPLAGARDIAVTPDGRTVYVSAHTDGRIVKLVQPNPVPVLTSLSPASATAGSPTMLLTVYGQGFVEGSQVRWNGANVPSDFISAGEVRAQIDASLLLAAATRAVTVVNPAPGGGTSNALSFTITAPAENPVPSIDQLSPAGAPAGSQPLVLTVTGAGYIPSSAVAWNGVARQTTYLGPSALQIQVTLADLAQPGAAAVTVVNPGPGGGTSNAVGFTIAAPGQNPPPTLDHISPASATAAQTGGQLSVSVYGAAFVPGAVVRWDGVDRPTTFVGAGELTLELNASDVTAAGSHSVTVFNPGPGGGESSAAAFTVVAVGQNPVPSVGRVTIAGINQDNTVVLNVNGDGFVAGAQAQWNGAARPTTFVSATRVQITLTQADMLVGSGAVRVVNPGPGGGASDQTLFRVFQLALPVALH